MRHLGWRQRVRKAMSTSVRPLQFWLTRRAALAIDRVSMLARAQPHPDRVLLVRVDNIGDFVLWLDAARVLTDFYRQAGKRVTLLGSAAWAAWAEELGVFDAVLPLDQERFKRDLRYRFRMARHIRRLGFGSAIHASSTRVTEMGDALVHVSGAPDAIGPRAASASPADRWYTRLIDDVASEIGELRRNAAFVTAVTGSPCPARVSVLRSTARSEGLAALRSSLPHAPYFVLFPGASSPGRQWPVSSFARLATLIHEETGWSGLVCGGSSEIPHGALLAREAGSWMQSVAGQTSLSQLTAVLAQAKLLVSNDTSAIHIGAALGLPSVCVLGGGHYGRFLPYSVDLPDERPLPRVAAHRMDCFGCEWICKFHPPRGQPMPCIEEVSVDDVWREVLSAIGKRSDEAAKIVLKNLGRNPTKDEHAAALLVI